MTHTSRNPEPAEPSPPISVVELSEALSKPLGEAKAREVMATAMAAEGLSGDALPKSDALRVLDRIAGESGLVGVAARFLRSRILLRT